MLEMLFCVPIYRKSYCTNWLDWSSLLTLIIVSFGFLGY